MLRVDAQPRAGARRTERGISDVFRGVQGKGPRITCRHNGNHACLAPRRANCKAPLESSDFLEPAKLAATNGGIIPTAVPLRFHFMGAVRLGLHCFSRFCDRLESLWMSFINSAKRN